MNTANCVVCGNSIPQYAINCNVDILAFDWDEKKFYLHRECFDCPCGISDRDIQLKYHKDGKFNYLVHKSTRGYDGACKFKYKLVKCEICHGYLGWDGLKVHAHGIFAHHSCIVDQVCTFCERPFKGLTRDIRTVHRGFGFAHRDCNNVNLSDALCCTSHQVYLDSYGTGYDLLARKLYHSLEESVERHARDCFPHRKNIRYSQTCYNRRKRYDVIMAPMRCKKSGMNLLYMFLAMKKVATCPFFQLPLDIIVIISRFVFNIPLLKLKKIGKV